jgi:hypothetical protein
VLEPTGRSVLDTALEAGMTAESVAERSRDTQRPSLASIITLIKMRAQGMPDAGRTREPCVQKSVHSAHARNHRAAETTGVPCAMG